MRREEEGEEVERKEKEGGGGGGGGRGRVKRMHYSMTTPWTHAMSRPPGPLVSVHGDTTPNHSQSLWSVLSLCDE